MSKYILAIDQGTTGSTALIVDESLTVISKANVTFEQHFPHAGWVEHDGQEIWDSVEQSVARALSQAGLSGKDVAAIGITNQRETTTAFRPSGEAYGPFIVWQCKRSEEICQRHRDSEHTQHVLDKTGLVLDPYFSATKMQWLMENNADIKKSVETEVKFGTIDTWLTYRLTNGDAFVTDVTNASRTLLVDLDAPYQWDSELCEIFGVPQQTLPEIRSSAEIYGRTRNVSFLPDGIPIAGIAGDQQAALFGQACFSPGEAKCTYGTGCFLLMHTGNRRVRSHNGLLTTVAASLPGSPQYALEGAAFIGGAAVQWLRDGLGLITSASEIESLAETVDTSGQVVFVPALAGLGAPHWRSEAKGILRGLSRDTHRGHIARAVLEGIAMQNADILKAMSSDATNANIELGSLNVDGGASENDLLMQLQANCLGVSCTRPSVIETTALGAAALAGIGAGIFSHADQVKSAWSADRVFVPEISDADLQAWKIKWDEAVLRA